MIYVELPNGAHIGLMRNPWGVEAFLTTAKGVNYSFEVGEDAFNYFDRHLDLYFADVVSGTRLVNSGGEMLRIYDVVAGDATVEITTRQGKAQVTIPKRHVETFLDQARGLTERLN